MTFGNTPGIRRYLAAAVLYGAAAHTQYSASIAEEYYVTRTRTRTVNGKTETYTERVKKHK